MGLSHFSRRSIRSPLLPLQHPCGLSLSLKRTKKQKKMQSLIIVLLVVVGTYAERKTSTGVDLEPIFDFLDDTGDGQVNEDELKALTSTGDADANGEVTAAEFEAAWKQIAVGFGVPAEKHAKYFKLVDGVDGSDEDGVIREEENEVLFEKFDVDESGLISLDEFVAKIESVVS